MRPTTLILVRHAETEANINAVWHGALDSPLTQRGRIQVAATGLRFAALASEVGGIDAFYVSPLQRAQTTAAAIGDAIGMKPIIDEELSEFDLGDWEGRAMADLATAENLWGIWAVDPTFAPPHGESPASFGLRALEATRRLVRAHAGETLLLVSHGGFICNVLAVWLGKGYDDWPNWEPHNCAIAILQGNAETWTADVVNDISHLPAEAIKLHDSSEYTVKDPSAA